MPSDILATTLSADSLHNDLEELAEVALTCDVLPPAGSHLRGIARSAVAMYAADKLRNPMSCAGSSAICHPDHSTLGGQDWLGMRAAANSRSGENLRLLWAQKRFWKCGNASAFRISSPQFSRVLPHPKLFAAKLVNSLADQAS